MKKQTHKRPKLSESLKNALTLQISYEGEKKVYPDVVTCKIIRQQIQKQQNEQLVLVREAKRQKKGQFRSLLKIENDLLNLRAGYIYAVRRLYLLYYEDDLYHTDKSKIKNNNRPYMKLRENFSGLCQSIEQKLQSLHKTFQAISQEENIGDQVGQVTSQKKHHEPLNQKRVIKNKNVLESTPVLHKKRITPLNQKRVMENKSVLENKPVAHKERITPFLKENAILDPKPRSGIRQAIRKDKQCLKGGIKKEPKIHKKYVDKIRDRQKKNRYRNKIQNTADVKRKVKQRKKRILIQSKRSKAKRSKGYGFIKITYRRRNIFGTISGKNGKLYGTVTTGIVNNVKGKKRQALYNIRATGQLLIEKILKSKINHYIVSHQGKSFRKKKKTFFRRVRRLKRLRLLQIYRPAPRSHNGTRPSKKRRK